MGFADYNPAGATKTTKIGLIRLLPLTAEYFAHSWLRDYLVDFLLANALEKNGVLSGCVISQDGGNDAILTTAGEIWVNGVKVTVAAEPTFDASVEGWYVSYITNAGAVIHAPLANASVQNAGTPADAVIIGYTEVGNGFFYINSFFNDVNEDSRSLEVDGLTEHIQPVITVGPTLSNPRATNLESTFVAALTEGDKLLFLDSTILTANRTLTTEAELWTDGPDAKLDLATFDFTLVECSGKITLISTTGKLILNGLCHGLIIYGAVTVEKGPNFRGTYFVDGDLVQKNKTTDQTIGTQTQVNNGIAKIYYDSGSASFKDALGNVIALLDGDHVLLKGLDAITADIDLSSVDDLVWSTDSGVIIDLGIYNLKLGSNQSGFINATSSPTDETEGNLSATNSPELVVNNNRTEKLTDFKTKNLTIVNASTTTTDIDAEFLRILDAFNNALLITALNETFDITTDLNAGTEKASTRYQHWIGFDYLGNIQRLLVPDLIGLTNGTTSGFLVDSTNTFFTDKVQAGDTAKNTVSGAQTTVATTPTADNADLDVVDDIFSSGEDYEINIETPQFDPGKVFKAKLGSDFNDGSSNLGGGIIYTQPILDVPRYASIRDEQTSGTQGGTLTSGTWRVRDSNTSSSNIVGFFASDNPTLSGNDHTNASMTSITKANPAVVTTSVNHALTNGDKVILHSDEMTQVNNILFTAANVTATTFELLGIDSTSYTTHVSGTLGNGRFILPAGSYLIDSVLGAHGAFLRIQSRLYNVSDASEELVGVNAYSTSSQNNDVKGPFTITSPKTFELHTQSEATIPANGLGIPGSFGTESYNQTEITEV